MGTVKQNKKGGLRRFIYRLTFGFSLLPISLAVNITNVCNRKCLFCPYHGKLKYNNHTKWFKLQPEFLNYQSFYEFLSKLGIFRKLIRHISITGKGEPLMHPHFMQFCRIINYFKIPFSITTNGDDLSLESLYTLLSFKYLRGIRVSVYDRKSMKFWNEVSKYLDKVTLFNQTGKPYPGVPEGYITANYGVDHPRALKDFNVERFCDAPFHFLTINTDGSIVPCYSYNQTSHITDSLWGIWNGKLIRKYRRESVNGRNCLLADCLNCGINL